MAKYEKMPPFSGNNCDLFGVHGLIWACSDLYCFIGQASHPVPCCSRPPPGTGICAASERVFSSSKETTTLLEVLQILKYSLKQRLHVQGRPQHTARPEKELLGELISPEDAAHLLQLESCRKYSMCTSECVT
ncbi:hypothetical protein OH76DRAFT_1142736 [Lentinus brumalis]|uniref:Uncharacterized protein n=1 Tax=Lentinus brumalis TaxID=2498619 RepID=A0A371DMD8_9APHY|nr:hypothetical protein OH76DRAFT_1142736 [Polyporus brumalis]